MGVLISLQDSIKTRHLLELVLITVKNPKMRLSKITSTNHVPIGYSTTSEFHLILRFVLTSLKNEYNIVKKNIRRMSKESHAQARRKSFFFILITSYKHYNERMNERRSFPSFFPLIAAVADVGAVCVCVLAELQ